MLFPMQVDLASPLLQYGVLGIVCVALVGAVGVLWRQSVAALQRERDRADRLETELAQRNKTIEDRTLTALATATSTISEALIVLRSHK